MRVFWVRGEKAPDQEIIPLVGGDYGINICNPDVSRLERRLSTDQRMAIEQIVTAAIQAVQEKVFS